MYICKLFGWLVSMNVDLFVRRYAYVHITGNVVVAVPFIVMYSQLKFVAVVVVVCIFFLLAFSLFSYFNRSPVYEVLFGTFVGIFFRMRAH